MNAKNIGVIIQARMGSTRFPGKVMQLLHGKPVLEHVIKNCLEIRPINNLIVAVPDLPESEPILQLVKKLGVSNFCGTHLDVLDRYYQCAKFFGLDVIVRITSDCPFINPRVCSEALELLLRRKADFVSNCISRSYPRGLDCEVFTFECLEAAHLSTLPGASNLTLDEQTRLAYRQHVTGWMVATPGLRRGSLQQAEDASATNLCVDYPEDVQRLEKMMFEVIENERK